MAEALNKDNAKNPVSNGRRLPTKRAMDDVDLDRMTKRRRKAFLLDKRQQRGVVANATDEDGLGQSSTENQTPSDYARAAGILFSSTGTESNGQNNKQATSAGSLDQQADQSKEREEEKKERDAISISLQDIIMNQPELARANESTVVASRHNDTVGRRDSLDIDGLVVDGGIHNYANTNSSSYASSDMSQNCKLWPIGSSRRNSVDGWPMASTGGVKLVNNRIRRRPSTWEEESSPAKQSRVEIRLEADSNTTEEKKKSRRQ